MSNSLQVPKSCCKSRDDGNQFVCENNPTSSNSFTDGCYTKARDNVKQYGLVIGGVGIAISLVMVRETYCYLKYYIYLLP